MIRHKDLMRGDEPREKATPTPEDRGQKEKGDGTPLSMDSREMTVDESNAGGPDRDVRKRVDPELGVAASDDRRRS